MVLTIIILSALLCTSILVNKNLLKQNETLDDWKDELEKHVFEIRAMSTKCYKNMKDIDNREIFSKDDEVGISFQQLHDMVHVLDEFINSKSERNKE